MADSKENYKFDLGVKGLIFKQITIIMGYTYCWKGIKGSPFDP